MQVINVRNAWDALGDIGGAAAGVLAKNRRSRGIAKEKNFMAADADAQNLQQKQQALQSAYATFNNPNATPEEQAWANMQAGLHGYTASGLTQDVMNDIGNQYQMASNYRQSQDGKRIGGGGDFQFYDDYMKGAGYAPGEMLSGTQRQPDGLLANSGVQPQQVEQPQSQGFIEPNVTSQMTQVQSPFQGGRSGLLTPDLFKRNPNWGYALG